MIIKSSISVVSPIIVKDLGIVIPPSGGTETIVNSDLVTRAAHSDNLLYLCTDDAFGPGSSSLSVSDGIEYFPQSAITDVLHKFGGTGDESPHLDSLAKTIDPVAGDDIYDGYRVGSTWINISSTPKKSYECLDHTAGNAIWRQVTNDDFTTSLAKESPNQHFLGSLLDYPQNANNGSAGAIQYTRIWFNSGIIIANLQYFLDTGGSLTRFVRMGIYDQADPEDEFLVPVNRIAQTNAIATGTTNNVFKSLHLTNAATGGSGTDVTYVVPVAGYYWMAFKSDNTTSKFAVSSAYRADFLPVRRQSATGSTLPAVASALSNPISSLIYVAAVEE